MNNGQLGGRHRLGSAGKKAVLPHPLISAIALALGVAVGCGIDLWPAVTLAQGIEAQYNFSIPAGSLHDALDALATQSGITVMYAPDLVAGKTSRGLAGRQTPADALQQLLKDSGLQAQQVGASSYTIKRVPSRQEPQAAARKTSATQAKEPDVKELNTMTVTGSRIRGGTTPSPLITIDSEQMQQEGFSDLGEVIRDIPQNFSGGQNPGVMASANTSGNNYNTTGGSSMNLRGLGQDATLTLLNGRRMSYGGGLQGVDISAIPAEAVERLEIVSDGASAVYGSDAVGGVANVILKPDFDGVTLGTSVGGATAGGLGTREYTAAAGTTWTTGGLIATLEKTYVDPIRAEQRSYTKSMYQPATLWPRSTLRSGLISLHQALSDTLELHLDALRTERDMRMDTDYSTVYYRNTPKTDTTLVSPSLELSLTDDWTLTASTALGRDKTYTDQQVIRTQTGVVSSNSLGTYSNQSKTYELGAEGPLLTLPAGEARLAAGAGYRYNRFVSLGLSSNRTLADGDESSRFAYAELSVPLVAPDQGVRGVRRLELTGAIRTEDYNSYGRVTTPKLGLIYSPSADFTLKASWGKSFKAPQLLQRYSNQDIALYPAATFGATGVASDSTVLYRAGGNSNLRPERAKTWSASLAFHPEALRGLEAELSWFDIDYSSRIVQPVLYSEALANPIYAAFVERNPTAGEIAQAIAESVRFVNYSNGTYDSDKVVAIVDNRSVNAARQHIKGLDLSGSYRLDVGGGRLTLRGAASWLDSTQTTLPTQSPYDLSGTLYYPAKLSARAGAVWMRDGFTASLFGNYKGGVRNTTDDKMGSSFTTFDSTLRYDLGRREGMLSNVAFELALQNLFNREPPLYTVTAWSETPYDSTNYSAVGRFVRLSVTKHW